MIALITRLGTRLRDLLRPRFKTVFVEEDPPERPQAKKVYVIADVGAPWHVAMLCPCGCGQLLYMNLLSDERPVWRLTVHDDGYCTLSPSILRKRQCRSHFHFRGGRIYWCKEHKLPIWRDIQLILAR